MKKKYINIGCAANDRYAQHMGVMIYSLLKNCSNPKNIRFFIVDGGISKENLKKINDIINNFGSKIFYLKPDKKKFAGLKIIKQFGIEAYYRFSLLEETHLNKLLYLDCDIIVESDITKLYNLNFKKEIVKAVADPGVSSRYKKELGLPADVPYFNSGVLLINCNRWKKNKITQKAIKFLKSKREAIEFADQDGLNLALVNKWEKLPLSWNVLSKLVFYNIIPFKKVEYYSRKEIVNAIKHPKIIHYANRIMKPWFFFDISPFKSRYWFYLKQSPWKNYRYEDLNLKGFISRIFNYLFFIKKLIR